jgi:hypothetical protein
MKKLALIVLALAGSAHAADVALLVCKGKDRNDDIREFTIEIGSTTVGITETTDGENIRSANWTIDERIFEDTRLMLMGCKGEGCPDAGRKKRIAVGRLDFHSEKSAIATPSGRWLDVELFDGSVAVESEEDWNSPFPPQPTDWPSTRNDIELTCRKL